MARILMIDDDSDIVQAARIPLEAAGHEFRSAPSGEEGLRLVREIRPDLIILDVMMESYTAGFHVSGIRRRRRRSQAAGASRS
jgi:DNA-binding response OmpR family regulator